MPGPIILYIPNIALYPAAPAAGQCDKRLRNIIILFNWPNAPAAAMPAAAAKMPVIGRRPKTKCRPARNPERARAVNA